MVTVNGLLLSEHARKRMHQRAIKPWMVEVALNYGEEVFDGHGCVRFIVTDRTLKNTPYESEREKLRGLCVVVDMSEGSVVTVEWVYQLRKKRPRQHCLKRAVKNFRHLQRNGQWTAKMFGN